MNTFDQPPYRAGCTCEPGRAPGDRCNGTWARCHGAVAVIQSNMRAKKAAAAEKATRPAAKVRPADVALWVQQIRMEPDAGTTGRDAANRRRRANNAREHLAKHNLGTNGLPLGRIS